MPFYIRKSVSAGPFRFNFSKGGVGVSVGVKGLRVRTGPRGHYVQGAVRDLTTWKRNAGATHLIRKKPTALNYKLPREMKSNLTRIPGNTLIRKEAQIANLIIIQIPVCLYEAMHLISASGLNELLEFSRVGVCEPSITALNVFLVKWA